MTPFPYLHRAYSQVPAHPKAKAVIAYSGHGGGGLSFAKSNAAMATPSRAETVCTKSIMVGV